VSAAVPKMWTGTTSAAPKLRCGSSRVASTLAGDRFQVSRSMSQKTGSRPAQTAAMAVAMKVKLGISARGRGTWAVALGSPAGTGRTPHPSASA
jgi:hypothetical protein